eukprot:CAMPEP_0197849986 /NCGR_PEP_ID=MMETSP1438-20131217/13886_1 /TAXON_ID=1461541 /ORGANISM="Pterosperma sp., Strain CCMP1384" /LENGTH=234 /DNA_ID=CAMNT_0043462921 /DNA_START=589 /DNA_END=1293 /DNA_ORIENTATION=+
MSYTSQLVFYSKSADKPAPGKGANEYGDHPSFVELGSISGWRKVLSNFHTGQFRHQGRMYNTAEHAFHARKFQSMNAEDSVVALFSLDSGSKLSHGDGLAARKARKVLIMDKDQQAKWAKMRGKALEEILHDKFTQNVLAKRVLMLTGDAKLGHFERMKGVEHWSWLEEVRRRISNQTTLSTEGTVRATAVLPESGGGSSGNEVVTDPRTRDRASGVCDGDVEPVMKRKKVKST